ncbi:lysophosphatidic acid receptor 3-like [Scleropages formosus]|uniref:Lysophosphatidic acid receptor 3 n=1 Tax=Scleropages formosus TaxID=113540 RepID=A0A0P7YTG6_SCLFO|nr:lysophosphatidic acid receptor 3-like [Scleropages formosus]KPP70933.1 lysophosphatidic acid receptor 3-like [Scleropages formosus]
MANQTGCHYDKLMDFFYDNRNKTGSDWDSTQLIVVQIFGLLLCTFILVSNGMIVAAVIMNKRFHFPFYYLLANLATSDFLAGIAYIYLMFNTGTVSRGLTVKLYFVRQALLDISLSASLANLLVIALERYIAVISWKVHSNLTKRRVSLLIMLVWALALFMGAVPSLGWNCICSLEHCSSLAPIFSRSYLIFWSVSNLVLLLVTVGIYFRIYTHVKRKTTAMSPSATLNRRKTPIKLIKTVMTVLGAFIVCWTPGLVILLLDGIDCQLCHILNLKRWLLLLAILNSVINPVIYSYRDKEMWIVLRNMLRCVSNVKGREILRAEFQVLKPSLNTGSFHQETVESQDS